MATPDQIAQFKLDNWQHALAVSKQTGIDPRIVMAQAGIESDWGNKAPGNNAFGIKGPGQTLATQEAGPDGKLYDTTDSFSTYPSVAHSFSHYASLPIIQKVGQAGDYDAQINALGRSGYATAPNYAGTVDKVAQGLIVPQGVEPSVLPIHDSTVIGAGAASNPGMYVTPPPPDPRTANDADLGGYGSPTATQPTGYDSRIEGLLASARAAQQKAALAGLQGQAQGLLASGAPQAQAQVAPQVPLLQSGRPRNPVQLPDVFKRGLLG